MSRNGSGTYNLPEAAFVYDSVISETAVNSNFTDIATALTGSIAADGQTTISANLPMNSKKFTGLAAGTTLTDSLTLGQAQNEAYIWCGTMTGTADAGVLTPSPAITSYVAGQRFVWKASTSANTTAMTIAISGLTTIAAQNDRAALVAGDHAASDIYMGILDTTSTIQIMKFANDATAGDVVGPASATDNVWARYNLTTGKLLQDGTWAEDDSGNVTAGGVLNMNSKAINESEGAAVASATTTDIFGGNDGNTLHITGATTIVDFTDASSAGQWRKIIFDDILTLTHGSGITLPGSANITTAAGDYAFVYADTVSAFTVLYFRADGTAVVAAGGGWGSVSSATASASANIAFTGFVLGYDYKMEAYGVTPSTDAQIPEFYLGVAGPTYRTANYRAAATGVHQGSSTAGAMREVSTAHIPANPASAGSAGNERGNYEITLFNPAAATVTDFLGSSMVESSANLMISATIGGSHSTAEAMDAIKFQFASGNIARGEFQLFRRKNS